MSTLDGELRLLKGLEAARELVRQRLRLKRGEWFLDTNAGRIDLAKVPQNLWSAAISDVVRGVDCVTGVRDVKVDKNKTTGQLRCTAVIETKEGMFELDEEIEP